MKLDLTGWEGADLQGLNMSLQRHGFTVSATGEVAGEGRVIDVQEAIRSAFPLHDWDMSYDTDNTTLKPIRLAPLEGISGPLTYSEMGETKIMIGS